tara:strand:- start:856 stop:1119 length:264 start_codon:yes stop_codon:yes gene_type:complete
MKYKYTEDDNFQTVKLSSRDNANKKIEQKTLSDQALGAIMMALQDSLMHQSDIVPVLKGMKFSEAKGGELVVINPPVLRTNKKDAEV